MSITNSGRPRRGRMASSTIARVSTGSVAPVAVTTMSASTSAWPIDDLQTIVKENLARRTTEVQRAELIVREEVDRFRMWMQSREVLPTVIALRERFETIRVAELRRLEPKLASLPPEARARVDEVTHLIIEKLLVTPTEQLKATGDEALAVTYADALNRLFSLPSRRQDPDTGSRPGPGQARTGPEQPVECEAPTRTSDS